MSGHAPYADEPRIHKIESSASKDMINTVLSLSFYDISS